MGSRAKKRPVARRSGGDARLRGDVARADVFGQRAADGLNHFGMLRIERHQLANPASAPRLFSSWLS